MTFSVLVVEQRAENTQSKGVRSFCYIQTYAYGRYFRICRRAYVYHRYHTGQAEGWTDGQTDTLRRIANLKLLEILCALWDFCKRFGKVNIPLHSPAMGIKIPPKTLPRFFLNHLFICKLRLSVSINWNNSFD